LRRGAAARPRCSWHGCCLTTAACPRRSRHSHAWVAARPTAPSAGSAPNASCHGLSQLALLRPRAAPIHAGESAAAPRPRRRAPDLSALVRSSALHRGPAPRHLVCLQTTLGRGRTATSAARRGALEQQVAAARGVPAHAADGGRHPRRLRPLGIWYGSRQPGCRGCRVRPLRPRVLELLPRRRRQLRQHPRRRLHLHPIRWPMFGPASRTSLPRCSRS
jgi:hypothetical protein